MKKIFTGLLVLLSCSGGFAQLYFAPRVDYPLPGTSSFVNPAYGDFNKDGIVDLMVGNSSLGTVSIFIGTGTGTFGTAQNFAAGSWPAGPATLDANNDGNPDIAVGNFSGNTMGILLGNGAGSFSPLQSFPTGAGPQGAIPGDFNEDGKIDIGVANYLASTISILFGNGDGTFALPVNYATGSNPELETRDLNNDNHLDLIILNSGSGNISVRLGTGTGSFGAATTYTTGSNPRGIASGDFNGDAIMDLAVGNASSNTISILTGIGPGTFNPASNFSTGGPTNIIAGDYNADGKLDLAVSNTGNNTVGIYEGSGTGTFSLYQFTTVGSNANYMRLLILDLNDDGLIDIVTANDNSNVVGVLLGNAPTGGPGTSLKFNGVDQEAQLGTWFNYQNFTISMWLKPGATQVTNADIIDNNHTSARSWVFQQNGTNINQYFFDHNGPTANLVTLASNVWQHVALVSVNGLFTIYLNGQFVSSRDGGPNVYDGTQALRLANWGAGGRNWNGEMDEVRIYNSALSQAQIQSGICGEIPPGSANLIAYYHMNEGSGNSIYDATINNHTGTLINGPVFPLSGAIVPLPTITNFSPASGPPGTVVTITGTNFNPTASLNDVRFNGARAYVTSSTSTSLTAIVPVNATSGAITVTENCQTATSTGTFSFSVGNITAFEYFFDTDPGFGAGTPITPIAGVTVSNFNIPVNLSALSQGYHTMYVRSRDQNGKWSHTHQRSFYILNSPSPTNLVSFEHFIDTEPGFNNGTITSITPAQTVSNQDIFVDVSSFSLGTHRLYVRGKNANGEISEVTTGTFVINSPPPPTITSFAPASGSIGTTVTITGTNFSTTPSNNIVYFGATRTTVTASTSTQLTVTVPVGATHQTLSVLVNGLIAYSNKLFNPTFPNGGNINACSFAPKVDFTTGVGPTTVSVGDLDGDGKVDQVVSNTNDNAVSVFLNTSSGAGNINYAARVNFSTGTGPWWVSLGDLDGDGKSDLAAPNTGGGNSVSVFRNTGSGPGNIAFTTKIDFTAGSGPRNIAMADLDGDGRTDLITANFNSNTLSVLRNSSTGPGNINFAAKIDFGTGTGPWTIAAVDLDGDNKTDIAVTNSGSNTISVFRNTSSGVGSIAFAANVDFTTGTFPISINGGDFDNDGLVDLAVSNQSNNTVSVFRNTTPGPGSITLAAKLDFTTGDQPFSVAAGDLDGDGNIDLATSNLGSTSASVIKNITAGPGSIAFAAKVDFTTGAGTFPRSIAIGDFDGDGKPDLSVSAVSTNALSIFRNTIEPLPTISGFSPLTGPSGTSVTVTGTNFSTPFTNSVSFNGVSAIITASTATSITATVPAGATTGPIQVTIGCNTITNSTPFVVFSASITISPQPVSALVCDGATAVFTIGASGTTNLLFQWQKFNGSSFVDISNGAGYSGVTSTSLNVSTAGNFGAGDYRCKVGGDFALDVFSLTVTLTVNALPTAPSTTGASSCGPASVILNAAGGVNGQYRWYAALTGGTSIAGEVNSSYVTPVIASTTTYFVTIDNGTCESAPRIPVTATINTIPTAPGGTPNSICGTGTVLLGATGGINGQYRWYTALTGGTAIAGEVNNAYTTPSISATTTYFVSISNGPCESTPRTTVIATVNPLPSAPGATPNSRCGTGTVILGATGGVNGQYRWYTTLTGGTAIAGEVNNNYTTPVINATTNYFVTINDGTCESAPRTTVIATVTIVPKPTVATSNCTTTSATLTGPTGFTTYAWSNGAATQQITVATAGTYTLIVTNSGGCISPASDPVTFTAAFCNLPPAISNASLTTVVGGTVSLAMTSLLNDPDNNLDLSSLKIVQQPASGAVASIGSNATLKIDYAGKNFAGTDQLTIEVCDMSGFCVQKVFTINVAGEIVVYSGISPNGNGQNDTWIIQYIELLPETKENTVSVFNRWGDEVFATTNYDNSSRVFKGINKNGDELPTGTYFYKIEFASGRKTQTGYLSLKR